MEMRAIGPVRRPNGDGAEQAGERPRLFVVPGREAVRLTARQLECLMWAGEGKSSVDIGGILGISSATVDGHVADACRRLGVRTRIQAIVEAYRRGWLE
jgi:DNA-binding CsgD family transcriptional regulator